MLPASYDETTRRSGQWKAGPGRGHTVGRLVESKKLVPSATQLMLLPPQTQVEKRMQTHMRNMASVMTGQKRKIAELTENLSLAQALLMRDYNFLDAGVDAENKKKLDIEECIGVGGVDMQSSRWKSSRLAVQNVIKKGMWI